MCTPTCKTNGMIDYRIFSPVTDETIYKGEGKRQAMMMHGLGLPANRGDVVELPSG